MRLSMGIFKGLYRGYGIYWQKGAYNVNGSTTTYRTIREARAAIDAHISEMIAREEAAREAQIAQGAIVVTKDGDIVHVEFPDGTHTTMPLRQFRARVFELEDRYNVPVVWR